MEKQVARVTLNVGKSDQHSGTLELERLFKDSNWPFSMI
jgi:hypothetical protein